MSSQCVPPILGPMNTGTIDTSVPAVTSDATPATDLTPWHHLGADEVATRLGVDPVQGLSGAEAPTRLAATGPNQLVDASTVALAGLR